MGDASLNSNSGTEPQLELSTPCSTKGIKKTMDVPAPFKNELTDYLDLRTGMFKSKFRSWASNRLFKLEDLA